VGYFVRVIVLAFLALQVSGVSSFAVTAICEEQCEDDTEGRCSPTCTCCTCCFHPRTFARREAAAAIPRRHPERVTGRDAERQPPSPPPFEIFHVPKGFLA